MLKDARPGDIVEFKAAGKLNSADFYLRRFLKWFEPNYDMWGWHLAILVSYEQHNNWTILEAIWPKVKTTLLSEKKEEFRVWRVARKEFDPAITDAYIKDHVGARYDVLVYFFTIMARLLKKHLHIRMPYYVDMRWMCWELARWFYVWHGVQVCSDSEYPLLTDFTLDKLSEEEKGTT